MIRIKAYTRSSTRFRLSSAQVDAGSSPAAPTVESATLRPVRRRTSASNADGSAGTPALTAASTAARVFTPPRPPRRPITALRCRPSGSPPRGHSRRRASRPHPGQPHSAAAHSPLQARNTRPRRRRSRAYSGTPSTGSELVVRHVIIFGHGHGLQRAIIDESQHRTPERLIMAQH